MDCTNSVIFCGQYISDTTNYVCLYWKMAYVITRCVIWYFVLIYQSLYEIMIDDHLNISQIDCYFVRNTFGILYISPNENCPQTFSCSIPQNNRNVIFVESPGNDSCTGIGKTGLGRPNLSLTEDIRKCFACEKHVIHRLNGVRGFSVKNIYKLFHSSSMDFKK